MPPTNPRLHALAVLLMVLSASAEAPTPKGTK